MRGTADHSHVFLGHGHESSERRTWAVIWLCGAMMAAEITGGLLFGSIALVADGMHMSTHAGALLLAALAYRYARRHAEDPRFTFGTGKLGDLAGFTSAIILAMIALLIGYGSVSRLFAPVPIHFAEALPIAALGLCVNLASVWLLGSDHHHDHGHGHSHADHGGPHDDLHLVQTQAGPVALTIFEDGVPPRFRLEGPHVSPETIALETIRPDGSRQTFHFAQSGNLLDSTEEVPEPHAFTALLRTGAETHTIIFEEHSHGHEADHAHHHGHAHGHAAGRDNNMRAAVIHVVADAAVSVLVIAGLLLARTFGWLWMDPLAGIVGACVIASWSAGLIRDTGAILLDMNPDGAMTERLRQTIEIDGDTLSDLHVWRLGPGHLGAILAVRTDTARNPDFYRSRLRAFRALSHITIEVQGSSPTAHTELAR